jgi:hypothetical protein
MTSSGYLYYTMNDPATIEMLLSRLEPVLPVEKRSFLKDQLREAISHLLLHDFSKLVYVLYRVDVSEKKLQRLLQQYPQADAAEIIADMLIERQLEKVKSREQFKRDRDIPEEDRW